MSRNRRPTQIMFSGAIDDRFLETIYQMPKRLILSSEGGDVYTMGAAIDLLQGLGDVEVIGTGCIFSAAVPILACGCSRSCTRQTRFMVHEAAEDGTTGGAYRLKLEARELRVANSIYLEALVKGTKKSRAFWARLMARTTFFGAQDALRWGLVDRIL